MGFAPGDFKASWIALYTLFLIWFLTFIPKFFVGFLHRKDGDPDNLAQTRSHRAFSIARDGVLLLLVSTALAFAGKATSDTINTLNWLFFVTWVIAIGMAYFVDSRKILSGIQLVGWIFIIINGILAWTSPVGRFLTNLPVAPPSS